MRRLSLGKLSAEENRVAVSPHHDQGEDLEHEAAALRYAP